MNKTGYIILGVLIILLLVVGIYYFVNNKKTATGDELGNTTTQTQLKVDIFNSGANK